MDKENTKFFLNLFKKNNVDFFKMYGQTEASPRMSYIKNDDIKKKFDMIARRILNGKFYLIDEFNNIINQIKKNGELVYKGKKYCYR